MSGSSSPKPDFLVDGYPPEPIPATDIDDRGVWVPNEDEEGGWISFEEEYYLAQFMKVHEELSTPEEVREACFREIRRVRAAGGPPPIPDYIMEVIKRRNGQG